MLQKHYQIFLDEYEKYGPVTLGPLSSYDWRHDPRHMLFTLSRYKFCAKMLAGSENVLEIGCGDAVGSSILLQEVERMHGIDLESSIIEHNIAHNPYLGRLSFEVLNVTEGSPEGVFDAALAVDVIEHIPKEKEDNFMRNICHSYIHSREAILILGTPNVTSQQYASKQSEEGHVNLKTYKELRSLLRKYFHNVLLFSMNDEVLHTGFYPMAQYLFGIGIGVKK